MPRDYAQRTPKKMKAAALRGALSDRARNDRVHVVSSLVAGDAPSTKDAPPTALAKISGAKHVLVVAERTDELTWKSLRNVPEVHLLEPGQLNTYDVLISDDVVFTAGRARARSWPARPRASRPRVRRRATRSTRPRLQASQLHGRRRRNRRPMAAAEKAPAKKAGREDDGAGQEGANCPSRPRRPRPRSPRPLMSDDDEENA